MRISVLAATVLGAALLSAPAGAAADPKTNASETPQQTTAKARQQGWRAQCTSQARGAKPDCAVNQKVVLERTGQLVAAITIRVPPKTRKPTMMVHAPLGLYLPPGITLSFGKKKALTIPLQTCDNNGCYGGKELSADMVKKLRAGDNVTFKFQNISRQDIAVPISLKGFAKAYDQVK